MAKYYSHEVSVPRTLVDNVGARTTGATGILVPTSPVVGSGSVAVVSFTNVDKSALNPLYDPSIGSSIIFSVGGKVRARGQGEGE